MEYKVISTGSKGNAVIIGDILIDCGLPFKKLKEHLYDIKTLLITHRHGDHVKESTLKNILVMFPHIKIYSNYDVAQWLPEFPIKVVNAGFPFLTDNQIAIEPFECLHDVPCYGYVWSIGGERIIYATDTVDLRHAPGGQYDYFFIESNYDNTKLLNMAMRGSHGYNVVAGAKRHMSTQTCKAFYYMNRKDQESKLIELHMSGRFY